MTLARTAELISHAVERGVAVPSFNVITLEHAEAIVHGAERAGADLTLQLSQNAIRYHGGLRAIAAACRSLATDAVVGVSLHFDHLDDVDLIEEAIVASDAFGFSSIMIDASARDYADNVQFTRERARRAQAAGLWVEGELGEVGGKDGAHAPGARTDPDEARDFVAATEIDGLAVAVGSSHAMPDRTAQLDARLIERLAESVNGPLVLHGSSGVPDVAISEAVRAGIRKVNIGTALNIAYSSAVRSALATERSSDPRHSLSAARTAMADTVTALCAVIAAPSTRADSFGGDRAARSQEEHTR